MRPDTLLYRQAHPNFVNGDTVTSQAFVPFPKDKGELSVDDGDLVTAQESYRHYTQDLGNASDSVWAVTKTEADTTGAPASPAPLPDNPAHARLDFNSIPEKHWRKTAKRLKEHALTHGCQFRPA
jgi:hypothetical protein